MKRLMIVLPLALAAACATGPHPSTAGPDPASRTLSAREFATGQWSTAYEAVRALRPTWSTAADVFVDGVRGGSLRSLPVETVACMHYYTPAQATARYGTRSSGGAIAVTTGGGGCPDAGGSH